MNRRDMLKTAVLATGVMFYGEAFAEPQKPQSLHKVNRLSDRKTPSVMEKKHVPAIEAPESVKEGEWITVKVRVGYLIEHPSTPEHWITEIKLNMDGEEIAKSQFNRGGVSASEALFRIRLNKTSRLEAIENCNLHGTWISDPLEITVV